MKATTQQTTPKLFGKVQLIGKFEPMPSIISSTNVAVIQMHAIIIMMIMIIMMTMIIMMNMQIMIIVTMLVMCY